jgi:hypothetical protein
MTEPIRKESIVEVGLWKSMAQARRDFTRRGVPTSASPQATGLYHAHCAEVNPPPRPRSGKRRIPVAGCVVHAYTILREAAAAD